MALKAAGGHGGNVHAAARDLRRPIGSFLDFSASVNPLGPSPNVLRALDEGMRLIRHYPDPDSVRLRLILASRWKLAPEQFVIANGSTELIDLIPRALGIRSALIVGPTFSEYGSALHRAGARDRHVRAARQDGYRPPLEEVVDCFRSGRKNSRRPEAVFLCNPNSPTGQACDQNGLTRLLKEVDRFGAWMVLDETFVEYCHELSQLPSVSRYPRLIVLRSFTKFYALPGLRIGYSVSSARAAALLRQYQPPWSVNVLAQRAAEAAIRDQIHARRSLAYLRRERHRFAKALSSIPGLRLFPSRANFLLLELPKPRRAGAVAVELGRRGLLIRDCSLVPGLTPRTIRVAVRASNENNRLVAALTKLLR